LQIALDDRVQNGLFERLDHVTLASRRVVGGGAKHDVGSFCRKEGFFKAGGYVRTA
jgi:hypothetical protein